MNHTELIILIKVIALCLFIFIVLALFVFHFIKQNKRHLLQKLNAEIQSRDDERLRISADLHDDIGPLLASVKLHVNSLKINSETEKEKIERVNQNIHTCIEQIRNISNSLMPEVLQRSGLIKAVEVFCNKITSETLLDILLKHDEPFSELDIKQSVHIYRIIQEIVANTLKHAEASKLSITFQSKRNSLLITTEDNGIGLKMSTENNGIGLNNIKNRVQLMNGKIEIISYKKNGLAFHISIPIINEHKA